jgi:multidrug efflux pump subunit AcrB
LRKVFLGPFPSTYCRSCLKPISITWLAHFICGIPTLFGIILGTLIGHPLGVLALVGGFVSTVALQIIWLPLIPVRPSR